MAGFALTLEGPDSSPALPPSLALCPHLSHRKRPILTPYLECKWSMRMGGVGIFGCAHTRGSVDTLSQGAPVGAPKKQRRRTIEPLKNKNENAETSSKRHWCLGLRWPEWPVGTT